MFGGYLDFALINFKVKSLNYEARTVCATACRQCHTGCFTHSFNDPHTHLQLLKNLCRVSAVTQISKVDVECILRLQGVRSNFT